MNYFYIFLILLIVFLAYQYIARQFNIVDKPNQRGSHSAITIRGGGIIFPLAALLWFVLFEFKYSFAITGLLIIALISFIDDIYKMSRVIRLLIHFVAVTLLFFEYSILGLSWYYWLPAYIVFVAWINAFNFMDGINGITSFYSLICLATFLFIPTEFTFISEELLIILIISVFVFAFFNARQIATAFAGDVGSVSMAFLLGWILLSLILESKKVEYVLFFSVYGIDSFYTIIYRLLRRENIFKAHRSHLYQYLSNELRMPHVLVSSGYAVIQMIINYLTIILINNNLMNFGSAAGILILLSLCYLITRSYVIKCIKGY